jgi:hypothetical protein
MFILLRAERIKRFRYKDRHVFQIVFISGPYIRTTCFISRGENNIKVDPDGIIIGSLVSKVLRLGEQKTYITGGIIRIGRKREGKEGKIKNLISETIRENKKKR